MYCARRYLLGLDARLSAFWQKPSLIAVPTSVRLAFDTSVGGLEQDHTVTALLRYSTWDSGLPPRGETRPRGAVRSDWVARNPFRFRQHVVYFSCLNCNTVYQDAAPWPAGYYAFRRVRSPW